MSAARRFLRTESFKRAERARVNDPLDAVTDDKSSIGFTVEEKKAFYEARENLLYYPLQGENGGLFQAIADAVECSRNYVLYTIWPKEAAQLFAGRSIKYKAIWHELKKRLDESEVLKSYKGIIQELLKTGSVTFKAYNKDANFILSRMKLLGAKPAHTVQKTTPRTYSVTDMRERDKGKAASA